MGRNGSSPGKTTWHTRKQNLACLTCGQCGARTYTRHSGEMIEWLRALKYSDLTHSATGAATVIGSDKTFYYTQFQGVQRMMVLVVCFLAHLSPRLIGELIVYPCSGVRPSVRRPSVRRPSVVHNFKHEYLCNQWADHNEILSEASLGWGKGCIRFWVRSDPNSGFHGNK